MKKIASAIAILLFVINPLYAYTGFGICNFGKEKVDNVVCYGPTVLKETQITGDVKVAGPLRASNVTMSGLDIKGMVKLQHSMVKGNADIAGYLEANDVTFEQGIHAMTREIMLNNSLVKGPVVIESKDEKPYLKMQCGTRITNTVTFVGQPGIIQITDDSIVQGKIANGTMEFVKVKCGS